MITSRRFALATAAIVLGLSACGSADTTSGSGSAAGTIAAAGTTGADSSTPRVIRLGAGGWAPTAANGTMSAESADSKIMAFRNVTYVFDGTFPTLAGNAPSWQLPASFTPDATRIAAMAAALGVVGTRRELPAEQGGGWMFGPEDYTSATFTVSADSLGNWWFSPTPTVTATTNSCVSTDGVVVDAPEIAVPEADTLDTASPLDSDAVSTGTAPAAGGATTAVVTPPDCLVDPAPPVGVPEEAAAMTSTKGLLTSLGYDSGTYDYEFYGDEWGASVTAYLRLGGQRSPISVSVGFGAEGALTWASGSLATPVQSDDYPLAGVQAGLDRLSDQARQWMSFGGPDGPVLRTEGAVAESSTEVAPADTADTGVTAVTEPSSGAAAEPDVAPPDTIVAQPCGAAVDCAPIDAEPVTIHLTDVRLDSTMIWDADGTTWLLPAYTFGDADGGTYSIIAVADEYLEVPAPVAVPLPAPLPTDATIADDGGTGETGLADTSAPTPDVAPIDQGAAESALVGLDEDAASAAATANGWTMRVTERDGVSLLATADYSPSRANVAVTAGLVTAVQSIG